MKKLMRKLVYSLRLRNRKRCRWFAKPSKNDILLDIGGSIKRIF